MLEEALVDALVDHDHRHARVVRRREPPHHLPHWPQLVLQHLLPHCVRDPVPVHDDQIGQRVAVPLVRLERAVQRPFEVLEDQLLLLLLLEDARVVLREVRVDRRAEARDGVASLVRHVYAHHHRALGDLPGHAQPVEVAAQLSVHLLQEVARHRQVALPRHVERAELRHKRPLDVRPRERTLEPLIVRLLIDQHKRNLMYLRVD